MSDILLSHNASEQENTAHIDVDFLVNYITGVSDGCCQCERAELEIPPGKRFCVILSMPLGENSPRIAAKVCESFKAEGVNAPLLFCRSVGNYILAAAQDCVEKHISSWIEKVEEISGVKMFTVYGAGLKGYEMYSFYGKLEKQLERVFYAGDGGAVVKADFEKNCDISQFEITFESILVGDVKGTEKYLSSLFRLLECTQPCVSDVKSYLMDLYANMLMNNVGHINACMIKKTAKIGAAQYLSQIKSIITCVAKKLANMNIPKNGEAYSSLIRETVHIIDDNIGNEELSLRWIAGNILYTNVDYLGKVFKKETGRNFSHYVMEKRMESAKSLILDGGNYKIYEIAEQVGFGSNSQYFSQVFKKYTGVSPLEYKEYAKALKRRDALGVK